MTTNSSKLLLLSCPLGLAWVRRRCWISRGNGERHTHGGEGGLCVVWNQKLPMPCLEVSVAPIVVGHIGASVCKLTGCWWAVTASSSQSCRILWSKGLRRIRFSA